MRASSSNELFPLQACPLPGPRRLGTTMQMGRQAEARVSPMNNWMNRNWSSPVPYDLTRTSRRASVPPSIERVMPETPGAYAIFRAGISRTIDAILDIGECGPRPRSSPHGLRGRLATSVAHSASERIARDLQTGVLTGTLHVAWLSASSKQSAKEIQDALITLFVQDCGTQPLYNNKLERHARPEPFNPDYQCLKRLAGCLK